MILDEFLFEYAQAERASAILKAGYEFLFAEMTVEEFSCEGVETEVALDPHGLLSAGVSCLAHHVKILSDRREMSRNFLSFFGAMG